jgi:hypothetical protein
MVQLNHESESSKTNKGREECWVAGILIRKTAKRFLVKNLLRDITKFYKHIRVRKEEI